MSHDTQCSPRARVLFSASVIGTMRGDGVPIHGVGLQMHIDAANYPSPAAVAANVRRLADLGLKVNISEMDV